MHTFIKSLLVPLLFLTPLALSYPSSGYPVFTLSDIEFNSSIIYSTPAHLAVAEGYISFNLTNTAVPYTTHCTGYSMQPFNFFYGTVTYHCDAVPDVVGSTNFTYSQPGGVFNVNQTWTCEEEEWKGYVKSLYDFSECMLTLSSLGGTFLGYGSGNVTLDCSTSTSTNSNWTIGQIYSTETTTCEPGELRITPTIEVSEDTKLS